MPAKVNAVAGDAGKRVCFPNTHPVSPLVRVLVAENTEPPRHRVTVCLGDPADEADDYWRPIFYFYAFACAMPLTLPYTIEYRREPNCNRLRQTKNPQGRDITKWDRQAPVAKGFYAFPERVPGSAEYCLDWSSGPDRYMLSNNPERPQLGWLRCLRFQAYAATKYHVLCCREPVLSFRVHRGPCCPVDKGWTCLFAFYAFHGDDVPGCSRFYMQQRFEPNFTTRVAKEPSTLEGWKEYGSFCALDVALPGTSRFSIDVQLANSETREDNQEMSRIWAGDTWEPWIEKLSFYAFAAPTILFPHPEPGTPVY